MAKYFSWGRVSATGENIVLNTDSSTSQEDNTGDGRNVFKIVKRISNLLVFKNDKSVSILKHINLKSFKNHWHHF